MEDITDPMEFIWDKVPKNKQGCIHYLPGDIPYLYRNGFVDSTRYTYDKWKKAFEDCKQDDGSYIVNKNKFLSLRIFRYNGPVFEPFDSNRVREGEWTDEQLKKLYILSIKVSSTITEEIFWNSVSALKKQGLVKNGNLLVNKAVKTQLSYLIERFPSPRRRLEKEVSRLRDERESQVRNTAKNRNASGYVIGKLSSEDKMEKFQKMQASGPQKATIPQPATSETIDLKKLKKPSGRISG